jgi:hypothetical protein
MAVFVTGDWPGFGYVLHELLERWVEVAHDVAEY